MAGKVPEGWEALPLRRLIKYVKTGTTPSGAGEYHFEEGGFNWYSPSDFSDAVYLGATNRALSAEGTAEVRIFPEMTVMLVGIGATIGKVGLAANESSCNQQINAIICNGKLDPIFATYYLKTMRDFIVKCGKFTTMPIINQDETKNLILTVPPLPEQTAIATYLDRETAKIDQLVTKVEAAIVRLLEYRTALITAAVTGKVDVRGKAGLDTD
ncbi:MAG: restriction endonuclease subunit S [Desulfobulbus sp.]|nr:restriction endonuclease subunit S [Desulfobulbus sp.]